MIRVTRSRAGQVWSYGDAPHLILSSDDGVHCALDLTTGEECSLYEPDNMPWEELNRRVDSPLRRIA